MNVIKMPTRLRLIDQSNQVLSAETVLKVFDLVEVRKDLKRIEREIKLTKAKLTMRLISNEDDSTTKNSTD